MWNGYPSDLAVDSAVLSTGRQIGGATRVLSVETITGMP